MALVGQGLALDSSPWLTSTAQQQLTQIGRRGGAARVAGQQWAVAVERHVMLHSGGCIAIP